MVKRSTMWRCADCGHSYEMVGIPLGDWICSHCQDNALGPMGELKRQITLAMESEMKVRIRSPNGDVHTLHGYFEGETIVVSEDWRLSVEPADDKVRQQYAVERLYARARANSTPLGGQDG